MIKQVWQDPDWVEELERSLSGISLLQDWVRSYMRSEVDKSAEYRGNICAYELGDLLKQGIYRKAYGESRWNQHEAEGALGDLLMMIFCYADIQGIDIFRAVVSGLKKLANREWRKKI